MRSLSVVLILLAGFYAGGQLGKIAPVVTLLQRDYGYSLVYLGWLTSLIGLFVAVAAIPFAFAINRIGTIRSHHIGSVLLFLGTVFLWLAADPVMALAGRTVEAIGYVFVVIAAPAVLSEIAPDRMRAPALAVWGGFVPIGYALANFQARIVVPDAGASGFYLSMALGYGILALLAGLSLWRFAVATSPATVMEGAPVRGLPARAYWLAAAFGLYVIGSLPLFTFLPAYIDGLAVPLALSAGVIALFVPVGNIATGFLVAGALRERTAMLALAGLVLAAAGIAAVFFGGSAHLHLAGALVFSLASGLIASSIFATLPRIVSGGRSVSVAMGVIAQAGGIGTVIGPPVAGAVIDYHGWSGLGIYGVLICLSGALCAYVAR